MKLIQDLGTLFPDNGNKSRKHRYGIYECPICKKHFKTQTTTVKTGKSTKCIDCSRNALKKSRVSHGESKGKLYNTWQNMKSRCSNKKRKDYKWYGAKGIKVCEEWKSSYEAFRCWSLENGYDEGLTIERIDVTRDYEPNNCTWAAWDIQHRTTNKIRVNNTSGYRGVCWDSRREKWMVQIGVDKKKIHLGHFDDIVEGAKAYDKYVKENNLEHTINFKGLDNG